MAGSETLTLWQMGGSQLFSSAFCYPPSPFPLSCWMQRLQRVPSKAPQGTESSAVLRNDTQRQKEKGERQGVTIPGSGGAQAVGGAQAAQALC